MVRKTLQLEVFKFMRAVVVAEERKRCEQNKLTGSIPAWCLPFYSSSLSFPCSLYLLSFFFLSINTQFNFATLIFFLSPLNIVLKLLLFSILLSTFSFPTCCFILLCFVKSGFHVFMTRAGLATSNNATTLQ